MARRTKEYYYNEHDEDQVKKILVTKKKKRLKRRMKFLFFLVVLVVVGGYFLTDYSKVQSVRVVGNEEVATDDIVKASKLNSKTVYLFVNCSQIGKRVKNLPLIKKASVRKDLLGNFVIEVEEADKIACCTIDNHTYVIDELGDVVETHDQQVIASLQSTIKLSDFKDVDFLKKFAKQYVKIPEVIKSQTSDIIYEPKDTDPTRLKFLMDNGKILYLRVEDMVDQLKKFDYEAYMTAYGDRCQFSFEGQYIYMEKCK